MNTIPDLVGTQCEALICQEYWYAGTRVSEVNVLFLKTSDGAWHRFFFDCGPLFWRQVDAPDIWETTLRDTHHYPQTDLGSQYGLVGRTIEHVGLTSSAAGPQLRISFAGAIVLTLTDHCEDMVLTIQSASQGDRTP